MDQARVKNNIQKVYCLTRPERQDRRASFQPQFDRAVQCGIFAADSLCYFSEPLREEVFVPASWRAMPGYYAATVAHSLMLLDAWKHGYDTVIIFEDDAVMRDVFFDEFVSFYEEVQTVRPDWLAIWLGWTSHHASSPVTEKVHALHSCLGAHAYIVNRAGIWRLLDHLWCCHSLIVDWAYKSMMASDACAVAPAVMMVGTSACWSDNFEGFAAGS